MKTTDVEVLETKCTFLSPVDISQVRFEWGALVITLTSGGDRKIVTATFSDVIGFRLLDEGDLLEFWPTCASANGWLYLIKKEGWFDLESSRQGFLRDKSSGLFEYFITSQNNCLSVLASEAPKIEAYDI